VADRRMRRALAGPWGSRPASVGAVVRAQTPAAIRAAALLRVAAFFPLYYAVLRLPDWPRILPPRGGDLLWPVAWVGVGDPATLAPVALGLGLAGVLALALVPSHRLARIAGLVGLLQILGLLFSFGKIHHLMHGWVFLVGLSILLPDGWTRPERLPRQGRHAVLLVFGAIQAFVGATYTLAGFGKIGGALYQLALGQPTPFHPDALARHLADRLLQTHPESLLGPVFIDHAPLLWPMMLGTIYLQLVTLWAVFRPRLHAVWGAGLLSFHVMTGLTLTIDFTPSVLLVGILFVASPFTPRWAGFGPMLRALPGAALVAGIAGRARGVAGTGRRAAAALALAAVAAAAAAATGGCAGGAYDRHEENKNESIRLCLDRCETYSPNDPLCKDKCYPYLVNSEEIRQGREARERERQERLADPDPDAPAPTDAPRAPEPLFQLDDDDDLESDDGAGDGPREGDE